MRRFKWLLGFVAAGAALGAIEIGCSSSSKGPSENLGVDSGPSSDSSSGTTDSGEGADAGEDVATVSAVPCADASLVLSDGATGQASTACVTCMQSMCATQLTGCADDCACVDGENCLQQENGNASMCPAAMSAFFDTDPGLTNLQNCVVMNCDAQCVGSGM